MIGSQKHLFDILNDVVWINCAQHSPALQSVYEAGLSGLERKRHPWTLGPAQYQDDIAHLHQLFARLIVRGPFLQIVAFPARQRHDLFTGRGRLFTGFAGTHLTFDTCFVITRTAAENTTQL